MKKLPFKQHIAELVFLLKRHRVRHVIICPGSRNAPLIQVITGDKDFDCYSIVDERSAGYAALGMSKQTGQLVAVLTTSGTAALNLAPAVAEAFHQKVPLLVLTADRPPEWPPQFGNQRISQDGIYKSNSNGYYGFPLAISSLEELREACQDADRLLSLAQKPRRGPVHLNVPLEEPLYEAIQPRSMVELEENPHYIPKQSALTERERKLLLDAFRENRKILVLAGMDVYSKREVEILQLLVRKKNVVVVAENLANLDPELFISVPELVLGSPEGNSNKKLEPDLVIALGGQIVSKKARLFVQGLKKTHLIVPADFPFDDFEVILGKDKVLDGNSFLPVWKKIEADRSGKARELLRELPFSNVYAALAILESIPGNTTVHLGNSGTVRYSQLLPSRRNIVYMGNRGTSGIDGSLSTAAGAALVSEGLHVVILGDLSYVYDSNAMWNRYFPENLRIIVLNDHGGGIFRLLDGPGRMPFFKEFSVTDHPVSVGRLAEAFGLKTYTVRDAVSLAEGIHRLFSTDGEIRLMEVETSECENSTIFRQFLKSIHSH